MQQWGVNYWDTYSPVVNWMPFIAMLTLIVLYKLHTKLVGLFFAYTQAGVNSEIYTELPLGFVVDGYHPIELVIRLDNNLYGFKYSGLAWFEKFK